MLLPPNATQEDVATLKESLGLDKPLPIQYFHFLSSLVRGDFGRSLVKQEERSLTPRHRDQPALLTAHDEGNDTLEVKLLPERPMDSLARSAIVLENIAVPAGRNRWVVD